MNGTQKFLQEIEDFIRETGCKPTNIGLGIERPDSALVFKLREGRVPNLDIVDRVRDFMRSYRMKVAKARGRSTLGKKAMPPAMQKQKKAGKRIVGTTHEVKL